MNNLLSFTANGLVIAGLLILIGTLFLVRKLIAQLPPGQIRQKWFFQSGLILLFIFGYLGYGIAFWNDSSGLSGLLVPGVFFFGAGYVWMTITLSLHTTMDIRRVTLLEQETITDPLIGVYNRRYLDRRLGEEFARAKRYQLHLALLLIDIDHFKRVNDTYGHPVGDQVLRHWGGIILGVVRASDIVARYGGEEILVIAPGTSSLEAFALAERIRTNIESHEVTMSSDPDQPQAIRITVSIGVTSLTNQVNQIEQLLQKADEALYSAKNGGRNRVAMGADVLAITTG